MTQKKKSRRTATGLLPARAPNREGVVAWLGPVVLERGEVEKKAARAQPARAARRRLGKLALRSDRGTPAACFQSEVCKQVQHKSVLHFHNH